MGRSSAELRHRLSRGMVIPAHPLALTSERRLDSRHQRALGRYYVAAGAGGLAVGVHTTQFAIRTAGSGMHRAVLDIAASVAAESGRDVVMVAGVCGPTVQAVNEAEMAASLGYDVALVSLASLADATDAELVEHCAHIGSVMPLFGFYLQPAVGGRRLSPAFWSRLAEVETLVAIKVAPFNRYQTLDVMRAVAESGRHDEIALYTGNDDHIVEDLLMSARFAGVEVHFSGGLLGQWAVGTRRAVELLVEVRTVRKQRSSPWQLLDRSAEITDTNAALFDAANGFRGCIAGIHEVLVRQGLMADRWCLDPSEDLSPGQANEIERVLRAYPHLHDDAFIAEHLDDWLR
ncbi:MAG: dihydrodipicolinate synthase family protein [Armatimonadetes bacterium]|nr:dihydrodipicolinate synthase family protein [Armatimonadota bacterium]